MTDLVHSGLRDQGRVARVPPGPAVLGHLLVAGALAYVSFDEERKPARNLSSCFDHVSADSGVHS